MNPIFIKRNTILTAEDVIKMHSNTPDYWLLLEVLEYDDSRKGSLFKLINYSKQKSDLIKIVENDSEWTWNKHYMFVFTDPSTCQM